MAQPLSIEDPEKRYLITTKTAGARLWFVNNPELEKSILGYLARYREIHGAIIYAFVLMGNHYHLIAQFPNGNRAAFMRDFNSAVARMVGRLVSVHGRRSVFKRRYASQILPNDADLMHWFLYVGLNPVSSGLTRTFEEYPAYNSIHDAMCGRARTCQWVDWSALALKKRTHPDADPAEFIREYELSYAQLPHLAHLPQQQYTTVLKGAVRTRNDAVVAERQQKGLGFLGPRLLKKTVPGSLPVSSKESSRNSFRPLVLSLCRYTKERVLNEYFAILGRFKEASKAFRRGVVDVVFPTGCYAPPRLISSLGCC